MAPKVPKKPSMTTMRATKLAKPLAKKAVKAAKKASPKMLVADSGSQSKVSVHYPSTAPTSGVDYGKMLSDVMGGNFNWPGTVQNGMTGTNSMFDMIKDYI